MKKVLHTDKESSLPGLEKTEKPIIDIPAIDKTKEQETVPQKNNTFLWVIVIAIIILIAVYMISNLNKDKNENIDR